MWGGGVRGMVEVWAVGGYWGVGGVGGGGGRLGG